MKLVVQKADDALYLRLDDTAIIESEEVSDGIILDYNAEGKVVGVEVLYISQLAEATFEELSRVILRPSICGGRFYPKGATPLKNWLRTWKIIASTTPWMKPNQRPC